MVNKASNESQIPIHDQLSFAEFPISNYRMWRDEVEKTLKGTSYDKKMLTETYEEITLQPMYWPADIADLPALDGFPILRQFHGEAESPGYALKPREIVQKIPCPLASELNDILLKELNFGQTAIIIKLDKAGGLGMDPDKASAGEVGCDGTSLSTMKDMEKLFANINVAQTPVYLRAGLSSLPFAGLFAAYMKKHSIGFSQLCGSYGADPLGELAYSGSRALSIESAYDEMAILAKWSIKNTPNFRVIVVDGSPYHNGGANAVEELAFTLATAVEYLRALDKRNLTFEQIAPRLMFMYSIGPNFFMEIAKLRASRLLWAKIIEACGGDVSLQKTIIHARTSSYDKTCYDPHVNLLRTTTEALSASLGGCDSLEVGSFDEACKRPDEFSRHLARNIQLILREESHIDKVINPSAGSWYVEKLTEQVAERTWELFRQIESHGGMFKALRDGRPQKIIESTAAKLEKNIARRKDVIVGTNMYANPDEKPLHNQGHDLDKIQTQRIDELKRYRASIDATKKSRALERLNHEINQNPAGIFDIAINAIQCGASLGEISAALRPHVIEKIEIQPVRVHRASEMFEQIRNAVERFKTKTGAAPQVFLANVGESSEFKARADFISGFFEIGGFAVINGQGHKSPGEAAEAAVKSQASIAVICSSNDNYPSIVEPLVKSIKSIKPDMLVILAGKPEGSERYTQAGVDEFIYLGCDAHQLLTKISKKIGVIS